MPLPKIARGNPLFASCAITDLETGLAAAGLEVTAFIGARRESTGPIDGALSVTATERTSDESTVARPYDAEFSGELITTKLAAFDYASVWLIFTAAGNDYRVEREYQVTPGQFA